MAKFTVRHLYALAESHGYKGSQTDWAEMKKHLLGLKDEDGEAAPITKCNFGEEVVDIESIVFQKTDKPKGRIATLMADEDLEDREDKIKALVEKRVQEEINKGTKIVRNNRVTQVSETTQIGTVKSGEEREYEGRIKSGRAVFSDTNFAIGFGRDLQVKAMRALNMHEEAGELFKTTAEMLTQKGYTLLNTGTGQALTPVGFDSDLHQLLNVHGIARQSARVVNMTSERMLRPKATGDLTVYYPEDGGAGTESQKTFTNIQLTARQGIVITKMSKSLVQDSAINVADDAGRDIVRAIAKQEDNSLFNANGNGSANGYIPGVQGILHQIGAGGASASTPWVQTTETSTNSRVYKSSATTPLGVTLSDVTALMALVGNFVGMMPAFHCTRQIAHAVLTRLAASVGGIQPMQLQGLGTVPSFMGAPIIYNNVMSTSLATGSNRQLIVFGDLSYAADFGDRLGLGVEISEQRWWDENNIGVKGTVRHDINVHELGTTSTAGPVAVLTQS